MDGINHQPWGALLLFYPHYSHEQKLTALQAGFQWPFQQGISPQNMAKNMVRLRTSILGSWRSPIEDCSPSPSVRAAGSIVVLQNGGFIMENPMKMDGLGVLQMVFGYFKWFFTQKRSIILTNSRKTVPKHTTRVTTMPHLWPLQPTKRTKC